MMLGTRFAFTDRVTRTVSDDGQNLTFSGLSTAGSPFSISVKFSDANEWLNGGMIQTCFPYLSADDRELLMTGIDSETWEEMFGGSEDD
jgi:glycine cleavage system regulatory protein